MGRLDIIIPFIISSGKVVLASSLLDLYKIPYISLRTLLTLKLYRDRVLEVLVKIKA